MNEPTARGIEPFIGGLNVHIFTFGNGLTLKVVPDHTAPVVAFHTWYGVGSSDEAVGKTGLAHLFEHMMFKGTETYEEGEYAARLEALGANGLNAWTWLDQTVYVQSVPKEHLEAVAELESTRMTRLVVDQKSFESELEVVTNERLLVVDNEPDGLLSERLFHNAFEAHPYGWPTVGWMADLKTMQPDDARSFYTRFYAPNNATIYLVGDVEPCAAAALISKHYGKLPASEANRSTRPKEPLQERQKRQTLVLPMSSDRVLIGFKVPGFTDVDMPALLVLDAALTTGRTGRLQRALRDGGWVTDVSSFIMPLRDPSLWEFALHCRPGLSAEQVEARFWLEIERVVEEGLSPGELEMGIAQWRSFTWSQMMGVDGKADFLGWLATHTGSHLDGLKRLHALDGVDLKSVQAVAKKWLVQAQSTVIVGHSSEDVSLIEPPKGAVFSPPPRVVLPTREMGAAPEWSTSGSRCTEILGAKAWLSYEDTLPLVHFRVRLRCGSVLDPKDKPGLALLTAFMLTRGTGQRSRSEFEAALEQLGASVRTAATADYLSIAGSCLSETWPALVHLLSEALTTPRFDPEDLELVKDELADELRTVVDDDDELVEIALRKALYGETHPYGRGARGCLRTLPSLTVADVREFYTRNVKVQNAQIGVVGRFDAHIEDDLNTLLCGLEGVPADTEIWPELPPKLDHHVVFIDKPDRSQCQVRVGQRGVRHQCSDFPAFLLANDCFGVGFQSRLMQEIRVKNGWSYFAFSGPGIALKDTGWSMGFAPAEHQLSQAIAKSQELLKNAVESGFTQDELEQMRQTRLMSRPFLMDTAMKRLELQLGKDWLGHDRLATIEVMRELELDAVNTAFAQTLNGPKVTVVVGTWERVGDALMSVLGDDIRRVDYRDLMDTGLA